MSSHQAPPADFWVRSLDDLMKSLRTTSAGLSDVEAIARLACVGANDFGKASRPTWPRALLERIRNPLITIDFVQERRANDAAAKLRDRVALRVTAVRDGTLQEQPATGLVPGDVVLLSAGDLVPADCRLMTANDLFVNEALTPDQRCVSRGEVSRRFYRYHPLSNPRAAAPEQSASLVSHR